MVFKIFKPKRSYLGVDIGTVTLKLVEISPVRGKPYLKNYGYLETYGYLERLNNAIQTSSLKPLKKETARTLRYLFEKANVKTSDVIASLPLFAAFTTLIEFPMMPESDLVKAIPLQCRRYIPLPISDVTIDWLKVGEREERGIKKQQIFIISMPNERIEIYRQIFKLAGLRLVALEIESLSLVRAAGIDSTPTMLIDIGGCVTNITIVDNGALKYSERTDLAGNSLTRAIARGLGIDINRAENLKKRYGLLGGEEHRELSSLITPILDAIIKDVERTRNAYLEENLGRKPERIILAGGGAKLLGISEYFERKLGVPVKAESFISKINYPKEVEPALKDLGSSLAVSIGLGLREFI